MLLTVLVIVLIVLVIGGWPAWGVHPYGFYPSSVLGIVLLIVLLLALMGRL